MSVLKTIVTPAASLEKNENFLACPTQPFGSQSCPPPPPPEALLSDLGNGHRGGRRPGRWKNPESTSPRPP